MPPTEPPIAAAGRSMPRWASSARWTVTRSRTVKSGKRRPYGFPVFGSIDDGPVVPLQPPSRFEQITKKRSVSIGLPGPISVDHQPSSPETFASPVSAWQT